MAGTEPAAFVEGIIFRDESFSLSFSFKTFIYSIHPSGFGNVDISYKVIPLVPVCVYLISAAASHKALRGPSPRRLPWSQPGASFLSPSPASRHTPHSSPSWGFPLAAPFALGPGVPLFLGESCTDIMTCKTERVPALWELTSQ